MRGRTVILGWIMLVSVLACSVPKEKAKSTVTETPGPNELPPVVLIESDGRRFMANDLPGNTILIFFGATCDHCQREATQIHNNLKGFDGYTLYFIAMDPFPVIKKFADDYGIGNQPNIRFLRADGASVSSALGYLQTPTIFVYTKNRKLARRFNGETDVKEILKAL